jgi:hypothetical protein
MTFTRGLDPKAAMGIGKYSNISAGTIWNANACRKNWTLEDLDIIFNLLKSGRISVDGISCSEMTRNQHVEINNKIVNGITAWRRFNAKNTTSFKPGDAIKVDINGTMFKAYINFKDNGKPEVDGSGRIEGSYRNKDYRGVFSGRIRFNLKGDAKVLVGKEKKEFDIEQKQFADEDRLQSLKRDMQYKKRNLEEFENRSKLYYDKLLSDNVFFEEQKAKNWNPEWFTIGQIQSEWFTIGKIQSEYTKHKEALAEYQKEYDNDLKEIEKLTEKIASLSK